MWLSCARGTHRMHARKLALRMASARMKRSARTSEGLHQGALRSMLEMEKALRTPRLIRDLKKQSGRHAYCNLGWQLLIKCLSGPSFHSNLTCSEQVPACTTTKHAASSNADNDHLRQVQRQGVQGIESMDNVDNRVRLLLCCSNLDSQNT